MKVIIRGKILDIKSKEWKFNGKEGISFSAKVFDVEDKEIRNVKIDSTQALNLKGLVDTENIVQFFCSVYSDKISIKAKEYYEEKEADDDVFTPKDKDMPF